MQLQLMPQLIAQMPGMAEAIASQIGQIDKMVVVNGGANGESDMMSQLTTAVPAGIAAVIETLRATTGMDIGSLAKREEEPVATASSNGTPVPSGQPSDS
jgi:uncharacterized membrane protein YqiK